MKVGLLGGGITSLALGYFLEKPYEILEKDDRCGGLCRTLIDQGYTFDLHGAHILFSKQQWILDLEKKLIGKNLKTKLRTSKVYYNGKLVKYPFENDLGSLQKEDTYDCLYHYLFDSYTKPTNLAEWCYSTFGSGIADKYLIPYNRKIWKTEPKKMGMEWVERIPKPPKEDVIKSALGIATEGYKHQLNFLYPEIGGAEALITAFEKQNKGVITTNFSVDGIYFKKNKWRITAGKETRIYDEIVSTIPIFHTFAMLKNIKIPKKVTDALGRLVYRPLISVMIGLDTPNLTDLVAIYFPEEDFMPHRVTFPPNFSSKAVPKGKFSLVAEITVPENRSYLKMDPEKIYENVISGLEKRGLIKPGSVVYKNMHITEYAYPVYSLTYTKDMAIIRDYLSSINLHLCGRFGGFEYINTDVCIDNAMKLATVLNSR